MSPAPPSAPLADLAARFWRFQCHETPLDAILAGEATPDATVFREGPADYERRYAAAGDLLAELNGIGLPDLAPQDQATHRLLRYELETTRSLFEVSAHRRPSLFPSGPALMAAHFANTASVDDAESAERYVDRLATLPAFLRDSQANLRAGHADGTRYPRLVLDSAIGCTRGTTAGPVESSPWYGPFVRAAGAGKDPVRRAGARAEALIRDELVPALEGFAAFLEGPLADGARGTVTCTDAPQGRELYRVLVRHFTTTELDPGEIHELGLNEVARLATDIETVAADAGYPGQAEAYRRFLGTGEFFAPSAEALRERIEILSKRIDRRIPAFFGRIPRVTYGVESMPEALAARMPPAYAQPGPADGSGAGIHWVTSLPARFPSYLWLPVALHEAWPGHLMHVALMQEAEGLPAFRRHGAVRYGACLEGWALYCEGLGVEMGLYQTPHQLYGRLEGEIWRAVRLVVDTGIHWHRWDRARAVEYMSRHVAMPLPTIEGEVDRYICWPGQALVYQIGNLRFRELRRRAEQRLGDRFRHRAFHDVLMAAAGVTLPVLADLVEDWLDREAGPEGGSEGSDERR